MKEKIELKHHRVLFVTNSYEDDLIYSPLNKWGL